jgi:hypothetical protein
MPRRASAAILHRVMNNSPLPRFVRGWPGAALLAALVLAEALLAAGD